MTIRNDDASNLAALERESRQREADAHAPPVASGHDVEAVARAIESAYCDAPHEDEAVGFGDAHNWAAAARAAIAALTPRIEARIRARLTSDTCLDAVRKTLFRAYRAEGVSAAEVVDTVAAHVLAPNAPAPSAPAEASGDVSDDDVSAAAAVFRSADDARIAHWDLRPGLRAVVAWARRGAPAPVRHHPRASDGKSTTCGAVGEVALGIDAITCIDCLRLRLAQASDELAERAAPATAVGMGAPVTEAEIKNSCLAHRTGGMRAALESFARGRSPAPVAVEPCDYCKGEVEVAREACRAAQADFANERLARQQAEAQVATLTAERDTLARQAKELCTIQDQLRADLAATRVERDEAYQEVGEQARLAEERLDHANALQADIEAEQAGRLALRKRHGAKEDETFGSFIERVVAERDAATRRATDAEARADWAKDWGKGWKSTAERIEQERDAATRRAEDERSAHINNRVALWRLVAKAGEGPNLVGFQELLARVDALRRSPVPEAVRITIREARAFVDAPAGSDKERDAAFNLAAGLPAAESALAPPAAEPAVETGAVAFGPWPYGRDDDETGDMQLDECMERIDALTEAVRQLQARDAGRGSR